MLKVFRQEGLIAIQGKKLILLDHKRIKEISETG